MLTVAIAFMRGSNLGRTDDETAAAADAENADPFLVHQRLGAQVIHSRAEGFAVDVRRYGVARLAFAFTPERLVDGQSDEALSGQFLGIQVRTLLLHRSHRVADDDRWMPGIAVEVLGREQVADDLHFVLVVESYLLGAHFPALVEIVGAAGHARHSFVIGCEC